MRAFRPAVLLLTFVLAIISGCTAIGEESSVEKPTESSATSTSPESTPSDPRSSNDVGADGETPIESPIAAAVTEVAGYTEIAVSTAVNNARFDSIVACMTAQGWDFGYADLPEAGPSTEPVLYFGNQIQYYLDRIAEIDAGADDSDTTQETESDRGRGTAEFDQDQFECWVQAETQFPDPVMQLWTWIAEETTDLDTRVRQDPRIVEAREAGAACFAALGYEFASFGAAGNYFNEIAHETWNRFMNGTIPGAVARSELLRVSEQVGELEEYAISCDIALAEVQGSVRAEYEEAFLDDNGARIALLAAEYAELLTRYLEFMPTQPDG